MPRIEKQRVLPFLYIAWEQDDYGHRHNVRLGLTPRMAADRCLTAILKVDDHGMDAAR